MLSYKGVLANAKGEPELAMLAVETALFLDPTSVALQLVLARYYIESGNTFPARLIVERLRTVADSLSVGERKQVAQIQAELLTAQPILNALSRALARSDEDAAAAAFEVLLRAGPGPVHHAVEQLIARCEFRSAKSLLDLAAARGIGADAGLAFVRARVLRFLGLEEAALEAAQQVMLRDRRARVGFAHGASGAPVARCRECARLRLDVLGCPQALGLVLIWQALELSPSPGEPGGLIGADTTTNIRVESLKMMHRCVSLFSRGPGLA